VGRRPRRALHLALVILAVLVGSGIFAVSTATAEAGFGPHEARYQVTLDQRVVVDLGPLGTIQIPSPAPRPLGVRVVVEEIPVDLQSVQDPTAVSSVSSLSSLAADADEYLQFFSDPDAVVSQVLTSLAQDAARRFALCLLLAGLVGGAGALLVGRDRGRAVVTATTAWAGPVSAVALVAMVATMTVVVARPMPVEGQVASSLAGTSFSGTRITGRLAGAIDSFGTTLIAAYRSNEEFYAEADENLVAAWDARDAAEHLAALTVPGMNPQAPGAASPTVPDDARTSPGATADGEAGTTAGPDAEPEVVTMLVVSDVHCNTGMSPLVRTAVERSGATVVVNAGDATIDGTSIEKICVTSISKATHGATTVFVGGNHDSAETSAQFAAAGAVVLRGEPETVQGITFLGDLDPYVSRSGQPTRLIGDVTEASEGEALSATACETHPDVLLIHNPRVGAPALASGCVPYQVSGHLHTRVGPETVGPGVLYVNSSTAGAVENQLTVGPLHGTAEMTEMRFDLTTRRMVDYRVIQVMTDRSATVGAWTPYPEPTGAVVPGGTTDGTTGGTTDGGGADDGTGTSAPSTGS